MSRHEPTPGRDASLAPTDAVQALLAEQVSYYRHRAAEYDKTSQPRGDPFAGYGRELVRALDSFGPTGDVLEIASGTGAWTVHLLRHASSVTALDASPEMHEQAARKVQGDRRVRFVDADVFTWTPDARYDVVFFANWLSHVPPALFDTFWDTVRRALRPLGRVFFIDELRDAWRQDELHVDSLSEANIPVAHRLLLDGRQFRVVKVFWDRQELRSRLDQLGWIVSVHAAGPFFWADGRTARRDHGAN
jgi:SAM-dependent methyltransferase